MSSFVWIDHSERQRRQVLEAIDLFREKDTRDELGIARIRDALSDTLFPGTGALQTRARYFFFVPWMYQRLEERRTPPADLARKVREFEVRLIDILAASPEPNGTIGIQARKALQRFPSSIYWNGLKVLRIVTAAGSLADYYRSLARLGQTRNKELVNDDGEAVQPRRSVWHAKLPAAPGAFPEGADFMLTPDEATFLQEQVLTHHPKSAFAFFLNQRTGHTETDFAWDQPAIERAPVQLGRQVELARVFSEVMHGAAILYNIALAELEPRRDKVIDTCGGMLTDWQRLLDTRQEDLDGFDTEDFWRAIRECGLVPSVPTSLFVNSWFAISSDATRRRRVHLDHQARELILARERQTKGALARCENRRVREMWLGEAGLGRLDYRWSNAQVLLNDINRTLGGPGARA